MYIEETFVNAPARVRFTPERPLVQLIMDSQDCRVLVFGLEPGHAVAPHSSSSTVLLQVLEGRGSILVGEESRTVGPGDMAICPPNIPHGLAADIGVRLAVLATIAPRP